MIARRRLHQNLALAAVVSFILGASSVHCGSNGGGNTTGFPTGSGGSGGSASSATSMSTTNSNGSGMGGDLGLDVQTKDYSAEDFFQNDPPPMTCDGGGMPPVVTGTPECPSDKNLPGCPCDTSGKTAACWTGLRKQRDHGVCMDGMTTCTPNGETQALEWGPCNGEQLPTGTTGKAACECFSGGHWQVDNLSPCFFTSTDGNGNTSTVAVSTSIQGGQVMCPSDASMVPAVPWSTDTLTTDCTGTFKLCYTIKAGDPKNPLASDCVVATSCVSAYYPMANQPFSMPPLPAWLSDPSMNACVQKFINTGGYGEMSVDGQSDQCELVQKVFQRVTYCPLSCNDPNPPASCAMCMPGGGGNF